MPKFYFHVRDDETDALAADPIGIDLPDVQSVRLEALEAAKELIIEAIRTERCVDGRHFVIVDGEGTQVLTVSFGEAIKFLDRRA